MLPGCSALGTQANALSRLCENQEFSLQNAWKLFYNLKQGLNVSDN